MLTLPLHFVPEWHKFFEFTGSHVFVAFMVLVNTPMKEVRPCLYILYFTLGAICYGWIEFFLDM